MSLTPEYGDEDLLGRDEAGVQRRSAPAAPDEDVLEREVQDEQRQERERLVVQPEDNELHAPGQVCERCGEVITASQDVRRLPDGHFVHEVCPRKAAV